MSTDHPVARYYDRNTGRFLRFGRSGRVRSIHRELWGPGVGTPEEASDWIHDRLAEEIPGGSGPSGPRVLDLGCGVGGTIFALARRFPEGRFHGITISPRQHALALRLKAVEDPGDRCLFVLGDFQTARLELQADAAVAIEAFVHASDADAFLERTSAHVRPGGRLLVVDDFLSRPRTELTPEAERDVVRFQEGWRVPALCTVPELTARAGRYGFRPLASHDFTSLVGIGRARDKVIARLSPWFERLGLIGMPFFANMIGGNALQAGLRNGFLSYRMVVFERVPAADRI